MPQDVVVNSLLAFLNSFRSTPGIEDLINENFTESQKSEALKILESALGLQKTCFKLCDLFDAAQAKGSLPLFAVVNLTELPLILKDSAWCDRIQHTSVDSIVLPTDTSVSESVETSEAQPNLEISASSPDVPSMMTCSPTASDAASSSSKQSPIPHSSDDSTFSEEPTRKRKMPCEKSLDAALRKLTELKGSDASLSAPTTPLTTPPITPFQLFKPNLLPHCQPLVQSPQLFDTAQYFNVLRYIQQQQQQHANSLLWPQLAQSMLLKHAAMKQESEDKDDDDSEKNSNIGSPSPSEEGSKNEVEESATNDVADKPFVCIHPNCQKRFANKFLLKKHMFIHTGLRPHACPYCTKRFNRKDNLLRHKKTHQTNGTAHIFPAHALNLFVSSGEVSD